MRFIQAVVSSDQVDDDNASVFWLNLEHVLRFSIDPQFYMDGEDQKARWVVEMMTSEPNVHEGMHKDDMRYNMNKNTYYSPMTFADPTTAREWLLKSKEAHNMADKAYAGEKAPGAGWSPMPWAGAHEEKNDGKKTHQHWSIQLPSWTSGDYIFTAQLKYGVVDSDDNWNERGGEEQEHYPFTDVKFHTRRILIPGNAGDLGDVQERALRELKSLAQQWADEVGEPVSGGLESFVFYVNDNEAGRMKYDEMPFVENVKPMQTRFNIAFGNGEKRDRNDGDDFGGPVTAHVS